MFLKVPNVHFPIVLIHFQPLKRGQPPYMTCPNVSFLFRGSIVVHNGQVSLNL